MYALILVLCGVAITLCCMAIYLRIRYPEEPATERILRGIYTEQDDQPEVVPFGLSAEFHRDMEVRRQLDRIEKALARLTEARPATIPSGLVLCKKCGWNHAPQDVCHP